MGLRSQPVGSDAICEWTVAELNWTVGNPTGIEEFLGGMGEKPTHYKWMHNPYLCVILWFCIYFI